MGFRRDADSDPTTRESLDYSGPRPRETPRMPYEHELQAALEAARLAGRRILELYLSRLRSIRNVRYVFPFGMSKSGRLIDYFLIFASQHHRGLEKMKEAMKRIDQTGEYRFSDAHGSSP